MKPVVLKPIRKVPETKRRAHDDPNEPDPDERWARDKLRDLGYFHHPLKPFVSMSLTVEQHGTLMDALNKHWNQIGGVAHSSGLEADLTAILQEYLKTKAVTRKRKVN